MVGKSYLTMATFSNENTIYVEGHATQRGLGMALS